MKPISNRMPRIAIEFDCRGLRKTKEFDDAFEARQFFAQKDKAGKNPKVKRC